MQQSIDLLRRKLGEIYPPGEIIGFTRMIFETLCGYTPTDILLHKDTILFRNPVLPNAKSPLRRAGFLSSCRKIRAP